MKKALFVTLSDFFNEAYNVFQSILVHSFKENSFHDIPLLLLLMSKNTPTKAFEFVSFYIFIWFFGSKGLLVL